MDNIFISDEVAEKKFVCDLEKCKGGCCEQGDAGAPLETDELELIKKFYEKIRTYLSPEAVSEIEQKGYFVYHQEFGWVTPTLPLDKEICVYALRGQDGIIQCAFEKAYLKGLTGWKKPISCHLFPVIIEKSKKGNHDRVNYEAREKLCTPACTLGKKLQVPVYEFLKEPLIRKYGEAFYNALDKAIQMYLKRTAIKG